MALFGRDYDRDYGYYGGRYQGRGPARDAGWGEYDREYDYGAAGMGYDRGYRYKSRWQTDYGDPFGDRISHTPMRMIRGDFHRGYGADYRGYGADYGAYGADYGTRERTGRWGTGAMGYDPYGTRFGNRERQGRWGRGSTWDRNAARPYRGYGENRYDQGW